MKRLGADGTGLGRIEAIRKAGYCVGHMAARTVIPT